MTYTVQKKIFNKDSVIERMEIHFLNGDFITIRKNEICNISITFYDMLLRHKNELFPIARDGFVKLKIQEGKAKNEERSLYNPDEYVANRKGYIEERCVYNDPIKFIKLYNQNNWSDIIYGDIKACMEGDNLFLRFKPHEGLGSWESNEHFVNLAHPSKNQIFKMRLDFENCDGIDVYNSEIIDMKLSFSQKLVWNSSGYTREVKGGYIKIKFENDFKNRFFSIWNNGKPVKIKHLERRICGKDCESIDICNLYIDYYGCYELSGEHIAVNSIYRPYEDDDLDDYDDFDAHYDSEEDEDYDEEYYDDYLFESGYAKKQKDGSILIVFGKPKAN
ncbi:MAG: hypothetical protein IJ400_04505 [Clostridia bacterium]|nr:hypothetical protein [Clostridia bacterium]